MAPAPRKTRARAPKGDGAKRSRGRKAAARKPAPPRRSLVRILVKWGLVAAVWGAVALGALVAFYAWDLPDIDAALKPSRRPGVTLLAADGRVIATYGELYGEPVTLKELPPMLADAVLATEDRRFYRHYGLDPVGIGRAVLANLSRGRVVAGGSTITQQLAKNLFLTHERTLKRKVQELLLALWLEHKFTKDQILTLYLNRVYLGAGTYGVNAASRRYFGRPAARLGPWQAAMLAGLLKAPSTYNPLGDPERAAKRTRQVLRNMVAAGYLTETEAAAVAPTRVGGAAAPGRNVRYVVDWVLDQVAGLLGPADRDFVVLTTLDAGLQARAERLLRGTLDGPGANLGVGQGAVVVMAPDGGVRALVGGRDYAKSQFNRATQALRQPGSAFKPIVYLAAVEQGLTPETRLNDAPVNVEGWRPRNAASAYLGAVTAREAMARSLNSVAVRVMQRVGSERVVATARRLGLTSELRIGAAMALGVSEVTLLELTAAYAPFANGGVGVWPYGVLEIRDRAGRILYRRKGSGPGRVVEARHATALNDMLSAAVAWGTGRTARLPGRPVAGKTGTSQTHRDAWFIGYTADLVAGVWMGNDDASPMKGVAGGSLPAALWRDLMAPAHEGLPVRSLPGLRLEVRPPRRS